MADQGISKTRRKVQEAIEKAEAEQRRILFNKRVELAASGLKAFEAKKHVTAVKSFHTYLRILEDWKGVSEGGLNPSLFDKKKDAAELLLISGVYWDLVKLYDRTKSKEKSADFLHYMEKFILFTKGMPSQGVCAETLRKYLSAGRPRHKEDFRHAYKLLNSNKCFVASELAEFLDEDTLPGLRRFREQVLKRSKVGRKFVAWYYLNGRAVSAKVSRLPLPAKILLAKALDQAARLGDRR